MDISETWKKLGKEKLEQPIGGEVQPARSNHPVEKLKHNYFIKTIMMSVFVSGFVGLFIYFDQLVIKVMLGILIAGYAIFLVTSYTMYRNINSEISMDRSLITVLTDTKMKVSKALRIETTSSLAIFPIGGAAGYMMGYSVSGNDIAKIFSTSTQILIFALVMIVLITLGYFLGRKLTKAGYEKYLHEIDGMIVQLRS